MRKLRVGETKLADVESNRWFKLKKKEIPLSPYKESDWVFPDPSAVLYSSPRYPVLEFKRGIARRMKNVAAAWKLARKQLQNHERKRTY